MVKFYSSSDSYDFSFPAVCLAYFLRYPNPYSTHVLSTDVIDRHYDEESQRITTTRLHLKRSKLPTAILSLLPKSLLGATEKGDSQSYVLEKSIVDIKQGWMHTESRNLELTGVLSVIENQRYERPINCQGEKTNVYTTVTLKSHIGENIRRRRARLSEAANSDQEVPEKQGFFRSWTTGSIQRSVELIGLRRAEGAQPKAMLGMNVVLQRLRQGGLVGVLEGMRKDRELMFSGQNGWASSASSSGSESSTVDIDWRQE